MRRTETVFVLNHGTESHRDRFDGEEFVLAPGIPVEMEVEAARLCLGFGEDNKARTIARLGWGGAGLEEGLKKLNAFSFHMTERDAQARLSAPAGAGTPSASQEAGGGVGSSEGGRLPPARKKVGEVQRDPEDGQRMNNALEQLAPAT